MTWSRSRLAASTPAIIGAVAFAGGAAAILSWGLGTGWQLTIKETSIAFVVFVALGDQLEIPLERTAFSLGLAPAMAFALVRQCPPHVTAPCDELLLSPNVGEVAAVFVVGTVASFLIRAVRRRPANLPSVAARLIVVLLGAAIYDQMVSTVGGFAFGPQRMSALGLASVLFVVVCADVIAQSLLVRAGEGVPFSRAMEDRFRATGPLLLSTVSVAALLALAYPVLRVWTLPLFLAPLAATEFSFRQVATIRKNYLQTVRALAKVPEMAGYTVRGHSTRVATLAVEIAKELGTGDPELHEVEYAALLHDIGRVSLPDPEEASKGVSSLELALVGAEIVEKTGHFPRVATMVREQNEPYRRRGEDANRSLTTGAKVIRVASAYDDLTQPAGPGRSPWDALERLHLGMAYDYDPQVIQALTRVLEKNGRI